MRSQILSDFQGSREFALVFSTGDKVMEGLNAFANEMRVVSAEFTAIGALSSVTLGYFEIDRKEYHHIDIREQVEVLSCIGNIALHQDKPKIHAHLVVGKRDGTAHGGHLLEASVRPTLEVILKELPQHLRRVHDEQSGLALIDLKKSFSKSA